MTTEKQIAANRRNATNSTGPRTSEGKQRVSRNALTHGLLSRQVVLQDEDREQFCEFQRRMLVDLAPVGPRRSSRRTTWSGWRGGCVGYSGSSAS